MNEAHLLKFLADNIFLVAVAAVSGAMLLWPLLRRGTGGASITTLEATLLINQQDAIVLDVREASEYAKGHLLHARNIPFDALDARAGELGKQKAKPVILVCDTGSRSGRAVSVLRKLGFENVHSLDGGVGTWQQAGLPLEK